MVELIVEYEIRSGKVGSRQFIGKAVQRTFQWFWDNSCLRNSQNRAKSDQSVLHHVIGMTAALKQVASLIQSSLQFFKTETGKLRCCRFDGQSNSLFSFGRVTGLVEFELVG